MASRCRILLTGATGYVGSRLLKRLKDGDYHVRCLARQPKHLISADCSEVVKGDVMDISSLERAMADMEVAFYLIHSMGSKSDFEKMDRQGALNFTAAAARSNIKRIVYLSGLGSKEDKLSSHLRSRHEVGEILRSSAIPVIELRASVVLGSGSLSYELVRSLTERLPVLIMPKWVMVNAQPIGISDLMEYLVQSIHIDLSASRVFEIGGSDITSYYGLIREYARQRRLKRWMIRLPVLTPWLSSLWLGLVTPIYARIGRKLIEGIKNPTVVNDTSSREIFTVKPQGFSEAIKMALIDEKNEFAFNRWSDALSSSGIRHHQPGLRSHRSRLYDTRKRIVDVPPEKAFKSIAEIGGKNGWYGLDFLWQIRGALDLLLGGVGMKRGRPRKKILQVGDPVDFWRVEAIEPPFHLRLVAEMKLPGRAWLDFEIIPLKNRCQINQTAIFYPHGFWGRIYWILVYPLHALVFRAMIHGISKHAIQSHNLEMSNP